MDRVARHGRWIGLVLAAGALVGGTGCNATYGTRSAPHPPQTIPDMDVPKELSMTTHPPITVAPPDILRIDASRLVPLPPYKIEPLDALYLFAEGAPEAEPVNGIYPVDPDGTINLGPRYYGQVQVAGLTPQEAEKVIAKQLARRLQNPAVAVSVAQSKGVQQIRGEHLIRPDGTVGLGTYGSVYVAGMTLPQVKACIEQHLSQFLLKPEVSVDVAAFNSKWYYVISDFAGSGENVVRLPATGNETILDAISQIGGLSPVSSKKMWIARPAPPRRRGGPDPAGGLEGHHPPRAHPHQLPDPARRPGVRDEPADDQGGHPTGPLAGPGRTPVRYHPAGGKYHLHHQEPGPRVRRGGRRTVTPVGRVEPAGGPAAVVPGG